MQLEQCRVLEGGHKATDTEIADTPVSQDRHSSLCALVCLAAPQRKPDQCRMVPFTTVHHTRWVWNAYWRGGGGETVPDPSAEKQLALKCR